MRRYMNSRGKETTKTLAQLNRDLTLNGRDNNYDDSTKFAPECRPGPPTPLVARILDRHAVTYNTLEDDKVPYSQMENCRRPDVP